jgi:hypothetical protein
MPGLIFLILNRNDFQKKLEKISILLGLNLIIIFPILIFPLTYKTILFTLIGSVLINLYYLLKVKAKNLPIYILVSIVNFSLILALLTVAQCSKSIIFDLEQTQNCKYLYTQNLIREPNYSEIQKLNITNTVEISNKYFFDTISTLKQSQLIDRITHTTSNYMEVTFYILSILYFIFVGTLSDLKEVSYKKYIPIAIILILLTSTNLTYFSSLSFNANEKGSLIYFSYILDMSVSYIVIITIDIILNTLFRLKDLKLNPTNK